MKLAEEGEYVSYIGHDGIVCHSFDRNLMDKYLEIGEIYQVIGIRISDNLYCYKLDNNFIFPWECFECSNAYVRNRYGLK